MPAGAWVKAPAGRSSGIQSQYLPPTGRLSTHILHMDAVCAVGGRHPAVNQAAWRHYNTQGVKPLDGIILAEGEPLLCLVIYHLLLH